MFSPITALDSDICLIRSKRGMRTTAAQRRDEVALLAGHDAEAPKATRRPPGRSSE